MTKLYARIEAGTVREIISRADNFDLTKAYHPSLVWVDITGVTPAPNEYWFYDGTTFSPPLPPAPPPTNDEIYDKVIQGQEVFKGYVLAINDGSIIPGSNMTGAQIKTAVKAKM